MHVYRGIHKGNKPDCVGQTGPIEVWGAVGSRSSVIFDLDNDGDLDIVTNEFNGEPMVLTSYLAQTITPPIEINTLLELTEPQD